MLSACATDLAGFTGENSADSLALAFLRTGAPTVVATRWMVDSSATAGFMKLFYGHLLHGDNAAMALQGSVKELRNEPQYTHPYYWAGVVVFGRLE